MSSKDLFGDPIETKPEPHLRPDGKRKRAPQRPKGHAAPPGTGPAGETCKTCQHKRRTESGSGKVFYKCGLMEHGWSHSYGTDIRLRDAACRQWEATA